MPDPPVFRPRSICIKVAEPFQDFFDWRPTRQPFDRFNIALTPLRPRQLRSMPRLMHCHYMKNGYLSNGDLWPQGSADADTYNFAYWQYVDLFCYFAHRRITIPPPWFINAAHQNGIPVIGTVIFENLDGGNPQVLKDLSAMFSPSTGKPMQACAILIEMARHYGFEGWLFNLESSLPGDVKANDME